MKTCPNCRRENPTDFDYCRYCGYALQFIEEEAPKSFWKKIPSWAWILIFVAGLLAVIALFVGSFFALSMLEGFASLLFLIGGLAVFGVIPLRKPQYTSPIVRAVMLAFYALMGATIDQPGNVIYNKPVELCFCEDGTSLKRSENVLHPLPGRTDVRQEFICYDAAGTAVKQINPFAVVGIRFVEYVLLGYLLIALRSFLWKMKN